MSILLSITSPIIDPDNPPASESEWTAVALGSGVLTSFDDTAGVLTIEGAGVDNENCVFVYKEINNAADIQLTYRISASSDFSGGDATGVGPFVSGAIFDGLTGRPAQTTARWRDNADLHVGTYVTSQDGTFVGGLFGQSGFVAPVYGGVVFDLSDDSTAIWESDEVSPVDADDWVEIASGIAMLGGLSFPLYVGFLVASNHASNTVTAVVDNIAISSTITLVNNPPASARNIRAEIDFETGELQSQTSTNANGVYKDALVMKQSSQGPVRTITGINKGTTPPTVSYSGTRILDGDSVTFSDDVGGATELRGTLVCAKDTTTTTFRMYWPGDPGNIDGYQPNRVTDSRLASESGNNAKGNSTAVLSSEFSNWTSGGTMQGWIETSHNNGGAGPDSGFDCRVVQSATPPSNTLGSGGSAVTPLRGSFFFVNELFYDRDHAHFTGNSRMNKPRCNLWNNTDGAGFSYNTEEWLSISYFLPPNYQEDVSSAEGGTANLMQITNSPSESAFVLTFRIRKLSGESNQQWSITLHTPTGTQNIGLGRPSVDGDLGKWTTFIFRMKPHITAGNLEIWKSVGDYTTGFQRSIVKRLSRMNQPVGKGSTADKIVYHIRQYRHNWHTAVAQYTGSQWMGWDEIRWGGAPEGTGYSDVEPFQREPEAGEEPA